MYNDKFLYVSGRKDLQKYSEWRQLWYPNVEDYNKAEAIASADNNTVTNVTVQLGATAYLHCHVRSSGDRTLSNAEVSFIIKDVARRQMELEAAFFLFNPLSYAVFPVVQND